MKANVLTKKFHMTDDLRQKIDEKLSRLDKFFGSEETANVLVKSEKNREIVEITVKWHGKVFRAEESDEKAVNALDRAEDILIRQIRKNKTRLEKSMKIGEFDKTVLAEKLWESDDANVPEEPIIITRNKRFVMEKMTAEEAVLQMNLLDHTFFMYFDIETSEPSVVYRKINGEYGVIAGVLGE